MESFKLFHDCLKNYTVQNLKNKNISQYQIHKYNMTNHASEIRNTNNMKHSLHYGWPLRAGQIRYLERICLV